MFRSKEQKRRKRDEAEPDANGGDQEKKPRMTRGFFVRRDERAPGCLAEREGFEPSIELPLFRFSRPVRSTAPPPLRKHHFTMTPADCHPIAAPARSGYLGVKPICFITASQVVRSFLMKATVSSGVICFT